MRSTHSTVRAKTAFLLASGLREPLEQRYFDLIVEAASTECLEPHVDLLLARPKELPPELVAKIAECVPGMFPMSTQLFDAARVLPALDEPIAALLVHRHGETRQRACRSLSVYTADDLRRVDALLRRALELASSPDVLPNLVLLLQRTRSAVKRDSTLAKDPSLRPLVQGAGFQSLCAALLTKAATFGDEAQARLAPKLAAVGYTG